MDLAKFRKFPLMGILGGGDAAGLDALVETLVAAGLETPEITLNTPDAPAMHAEQGIP